MKLSFFFVPVLVFSGLIISSYQNSSYDYYKEGLSKIKNKDYKSALEDFTNAIKLVPFLLTSYLII